MIDHVNTGLHRQVPQVKGQIKLRRSSQISYLGSVRFFKHLIIGVVLVMLILPWMAMTGVYSRAEPADPDIAGQLGELARQQEALLQELEDYKSENRLLLQELDKARVLYDFDSPYSQLHPELRVSGPQEYIDSTKVIYLTFDDGPGVNTRAVLKILDKYNIKATFFVVGYAIEGREELLRQIVEEGHTIGIHSYSHVYKEIYNSVEGFLDDFAKVSNKIEEVTGIKADIFRFPGGSVNSFNEGWGNTIISEMLSRGYRYYDWNVGSSDVAADATAGSIYNAVINQAHSHSYSVVLLHDGGGSKARTVEALPQIIEKLLSEGYSFDKMTNQVKPTVFNTGSYSRG
ncbi:MAG: polysaccharide deacetylase family protein [Clostridiales bacterium]